MILKLGRRSGISPATRRSKTCLRAGSARAATQLGCDGLLYGAQTRAPARHQQRAAGNDARTTPGKGATMAERFRTQRPRGPRLQPGPHPPATSVTFGAASGSGGNGIASEGADKPKSTSTDDKSTLRMGFDLSNAHESVQTVRSLHRRSVRTRQSISTEIRMKSSSGLEVQKGTLILGGGTGTF
jgi:hypothetical protein